MNTAVPQATFAGGDAEATLDATPRLSARSTAASTVAASAAAAAIPQTSPAPAAKNRTGQIIAAVVLVAAVASGGWFMLHRNQAAVPQAAPPPAPAPQAVATQAQVAPAPEKPAVPTPAPAAKAPTPAKPPATPLVAAPAPQPRLAPVAFNPKTLDPKQNARLKIDLSHLPPAMTFTVEMNGKLYCKGTAGKKADYDGLYVPPGVHEFRVTVSSGSVQKASSTVSAEFVAKKHLTLKAELRPQPTDNSVALAPNTQVVATLKNDLFQF